ncbi:MAG: hypothetical protein ACOVQA_09795 [Thermoflexibacteraceae bacterium]|jgi:hypothetical protein
MNNLAFFQNWSFLRAARLLMGLLVIGQGYSMHDSFVMVMGALLGSMALLNVGCCATGSCGVNSSAKKEAQQTDKPIEYEEVKSS